MPNHSCSGQFTYNRITGEREPNLRYMPPKSQKDNSIWGPVGRGYYHKGPGNYFCTSCNHVFSPTRQDKRFGFRGPEACGNCGSHAIVGIGNSIRVPRKTASARVWRTFRTMFIDELVAYKIQRNPRWPNPEHTEEEWDAIIAAREAAEAVELAETN